MTSQFTKCRCLHSHWCLPVPFLPPPPPSPGPMPLRKYADTWKSGTPATCRLFELSCFWILWELWLELRYRTIRLAEIQTQKKCADFLAPKNTRLNFQPPQNTGVDNFRPKKIRQTRPCHAYTRVSPLGREYPPPRKIYQKLTYSFAQNVNPYTQKIPQSLMCTSY